MVCGQLEVDGIVEEAVWSTQAPRNGMKENQTRNLKTLESWVQKIGLNLESYSRIRKHIGQSPPYRKTENSYDKPSQRLQGPDPDAHGEQVRVLFNQIGFYDSRRTEIFY